MTKSGFDSQWGQHMRKFEKKGFTRFAPNDCRAGHATELDEQGGNATRNLQQSNSRVTDAHYLRRGKKLELLRRVK